MFRHFFKKKKSEVCDYRSQVDILNRSNTNYRYSELNLSRDRKAEPQI